MQFQEVDQSELLNFLVEVTSDRIRKYCSVDFELLDGPAELNGDKYASEMSIIMTWGAVGSMTFKIHFDLELAKKLCAKSLGQKPEQVEDKVAREFAREMSNLQAGFIRGVFSSNRVGMGMSLPFLAAGEDEPVFRKLRDPRSHFRCWKLKCSDGELICTAEVLILDQKIIDSLKPTMKATVESCKQKDSSSDGEIEFF